MRRWLPVLFFVALSFALFSPAFVGGRLFFPMHTDLLEPWRSAQSPERIAELEDCFNPELTDKDFLFHPDTQLMVDEWKQGRAPLWNPHLLGGVSQIGQALLGAFYPPNAVLLAFERLEEAYAWAAALHVLAALLGTYLLLRAWGLGAAAATLGAVAFAVGGPMAVRYHYYMTFYPVVWIPWLWWATERFVRAPSLRRWCALPPFVALVVLTGFPQTGLYGLYLVALWGGLRALAPGLRRGRPRDVDERGDSGLLPGLRITASLGLAFALGGVLTSVQILPVAEVQGLPALEERGRSLPRDRSLDDQVRTAGSPWLPMGTVLPTVFVDPRSSFHSSWYRNPSWGALYARVDEVDGARTPRQEPQPNRTEDGCYTGLVLLVLALIGMRSGPRRRALLLAALLALCWAYALGWRPLVAAYRFLPGGDMGDVRRILPTVGLLVALLAAAGAQAFARGSRRLRGATVAAAGLIAASLGALWGAIVHLGADGTWDLLSRRIAERSSTPLPPVTEASRAEYFDFLRGSVGSASLWAAGGVAALAVAAAVARRRPSLSAAILIAFVAVELGAHHLRTNPFVPADGFLRDTPVASAVRGDAEGTRVHRFFPGPRKELDTQRDAVLPNNLSICLGVDDAAGYIVAVPERYAAYLRALQPAPEHVVTVLVYPLSPDPATGRPEALDSPLLDLASIRHLLTRDEVPARMRAAGMDPGRWTLLFEDGGNRVYRNERALPFASVLTGARPRPAYPAGPERDRLHREILARLAAGESRLEVEGLPEMPAAGTETAAVELLPPDAHRTEALPDDPDRESTAPPPAAAAVASWRRSPGRVQVELTPGAAGTLYLTQGHDPGWRATVDGAPSPVYPANVAFQAIALPEGARRVELSYEPAAFRAGSGLSRAALVLWALLVLVGLAIPRDPRGH